MGHLRLEQGYAIEAYLKSRKTKVFIAKLLGIDESTIRREIKYNPKFAQELADERKERLL
ncbi:MAG: hypothetical protein ACK5MI_04305 [Mangrovibacterium sp.]